MHANETAVKEQKLDGPKSKHGEDQFKYEKAKNGNAKAKNGNAKAKREKVANLKPQPTKANFAHAKPSHVKDVKATKP